MKAIRIPEPRVLELAEVPMPPSPQGDQVLVKVAYAGICGSDIHIFHGTSPVATYPRIIGHEMTGAVVETGAQVRDLRTGDHVVLDPVISCGQCRNCRAGRTNVCASLRVRGVHVDGGYQQVLLVPRSGLHRVSAELPWKKAVMIEPFTVAAQTVSRGEVSAEDTVFIMGAGPVGLTVLMVARMLGARCLVSDLVGSRLELAKRLGADAVIDAGREDVAQAIRRETDGLGPAVIIDSVCTTRSVEQAMGLVASAGRVVVLGFSGEPSQIRQLDITAKELDVRGSRLHAGRFPQVIEWFSQGKIDPSPLVSAVYHFTEVQAAMKQVETRPDEIIKVLLDFSEERR
jgi:2-desacetyl-2-hydroxyethyl bacteriochlorophyllide A dehydrogenase